MKIDQNTLKKLYFNYLSSISPDTRNDCPSPELLLKSIRGTLKRRKREGVIRHLTNCIHCSMEFQALLETIRQENKFNSEIADSAIIQNRMKESPIRSFRKTIHRWPKVLAYMIPIILAICISAVFILQIPQKANYRRTRASPLQIIHPKEAHVDLAALVFKWTALPDTEYYILEVYDESLLPLWTSPKVRGAFIIAPLALKAELKKDSTYFWMVTAFKTSGLQIESQLVEFYLNE